MLGSVEGRLLRPLGFALRRGADRFAVVALTVTPVLCSLLLADVAPDCVGHRAVVDATSQGRVRAMARPRVHVLADGTCRCAAAVVVAALVGILAAGRSFLPEFNEGALTVSAVTIPGTSLADSNRSAMPWSG